ncbi:hypothetical protein ACM614_15055 [Streptomyces sp. 12297]|uniref:hypothetical protein n=1 Tax=Streptomyces sp. NBC_00239 TaxID=2903640 RepID=UPI002E27F5D1|nr:hypothetical protein [Streptomyces sp. NBC_00239]
MAELAAATGTYVLASSSPTRAAVARPGNKYPDFTAAMIDILERGVKDGPEVLDVQTIFSALEERLAGHGSPQPRMIATGDARLALGLNRLAASTAPAET